MLAPLAPAVGLLDDTGSSSSDRITFDGRIVAKATTGAPIRYSTTPGVWTASPPIPHEGLNTVTVRSIDPLLGWSLPRRFSYVLDTVAPRAPLVHPKNAAGSDDPLPFIERNEMLVIERDAKTSAFITSVDGRSTRIPPNPKGAVSVGALPLSPDAGPHVITASAYDVAGNAASSTFEFRSSPLVAAPQASAALSPPSRPTVPQSVVPRSNPYVVNVKEYGAIGDNVANDAPAIRAAWLAATLTGQPLYFPVGTYFVGTDQLILSLEYCQNVGVTVSGDGVGRSIINCMEVKKSPQMLITCPTTPGDNVFLSMKGIGVFTKTTGVGVQFGAETYGDPINEPEIDLMVLNFDTSKTAVAVEMNSVLNGDIRLVANTSGAGTSLLLRQASFNHFTGSYGGVGGVAIRLSAGFNDGNVFTALDMENVATCVISDSKHNLGNTFIGGTWSYTRNGVVSTSGRRLVIINPQLNLPKPGTVSGFLGAAVGVIVWPFPPLA